MEVGLITELCAPDLTTLLERAISDFGQARSQSVQSLCDEILRHRPDEPGALNLLALLALQRKKPVQALSLVDRALRADSSQPWLHNTRAQALSALGRLKEAKLAYAQAWSLRPGSAAIANNLGCLIRTMGDVAEAVGWFNVALQAEPSCADIASNLASVLADAGEFDRAAETFDHALRLRPGCPDILGQQAAMLLAWGQSSEAQAPVRPVRQRHAGPALSHLALALDQQHRPDLAIGMLREAIRRDPECTDAHYHLGSLLLLDHQQDEARACHERALAIDPLHGKALWARCTVELPVLYETPAEIPRQRRRYRRALQHLERAAQDPAVAVSLGRAAGSSVPALLPYQGRLDLPLQARFGRLMAGLHAAPFTAPAPPLPGEPIRLGIVSGFFCEHSIWSLMLRGWLSELDRFRFEVTAYHTGPTDDAQTRMARSLCPRFTSGPVETIRAAVLQSRPHVLLYPEFGLDPAAARLASERLAPVQAVGWGQPGTTGLPTMDLFFSSAWMEPPDAARHYTERLVPLPKLGIHYAADVRRIGRVTRAEIGVRESATLFWCPQTLGKYLPQHDQVLPRIALEVGDCQFVFIASGRSASLTARFLERLRLAFRAHGLDPARHLVILPSMPQPRFLGITQLADIVLDSIGWSGGKSTLDMLALAPVIVTLPGPLMRGRHTAGILNGMGVTETVAETIEDYIAIAARLSRSRTARYAIRRAMRAGRRRILSDPTPIRAMENVLEQAVFNQAQSS